MPKVSLPLEDLLQAVNGLRGPVINLYCSFGGSIVFRFHQIKYVKMVHEI